MAPKGNPITAAATVTAAAAGALALYFALKNRRNNHRNPRDIVPLHGAPKCSPRLPKSVVPNRYDVSLAPDIDAGIFSGTVDVSVDIVEETKFVALNIADLSIADSAISLKHNNIEQKFVPSVSIDPYEELLILKFEELLPIGGAVLHVEFEGTLNSQMKGFYRSNYTVEGVEKSMAVTQFEPSDARRCFPCWDEPSFKAVFSITLLIAEGLEALSNMPVQSADFLEGSKQKIRFLDSPIMSSYLVAFVVGEFGFIEGSTQQESNAFSSPSGSGLPVRVYTEKGAEETGRFALEVALKTLPFFSGYFGTPYPLPKLDMVAISDFAAGAMENYGLITYRASSLLVDSLSTSAANKQKIAITVTHELAHQWFGNLVTMEWWDNLWLNEGFATWVSYLAVDHLFPEWHIWTQFTTTQMATAFRLDGLQNSHPIQVEVGSVREIDEIFDSISYNKGASIIRMLQSYLGAETFQRGLAAYIQLYAYKNTKTEDLWNSLSEVANQPVARLMEGWTQQMGYPVLSVHLNSSGNFLEISQERYLSMGFPAAGDWVVPLTLIAGGYGSYESQLIESKSTVIELSGEVDFVKLNVGQAGFYRVQYDKELTARLAKAVEKGQLASSDRFGLLDDSFAMSRAGRQSLASLLTLLKAYAGESDFTVLRALSEVVTSIAALLLDALPESVTSFRHFAANILRSRARELGWESKEGESHLDSMLRGILLEAMVSLQDEEAIAEAKSRFWSFVGNPSGSNLLPDVRKAVYLSAVLDASEVKLDGYDSLMKLYRETAGSEEKSRILFALGSCPASILRQSLDFILTPEVRPQDAIFLLGGLGASSRDVAWAWLQEKWDEIFVIWGEGFLISRFVVACSQFFSSEEKAKEIESFFAAKNCIPINRSVDQCVERIRASAKQVASVRSEEALVEWIRTL